MAKLSLDRILQSQGFGSRKWCAELVRDGEVVFNGLSLTDPKLTLETTGLAFTLFGEDWLFRDKVYLALHKPVGYECSRKPSHHPSVFRLLPDQFSLREVQPVGRLDFDTTGLLLLSDDGQFIHTQSSPKHHVAKVYLATTSEPVTDGLIENLLGGVLLHDEPAPLAAQHCQQVGEYQLEIILEQGKYHQVKRMLAAAGNHCAALHRSQIGGLKLEQLGLAPGEWCYLDDWLPQLRECD